MNSYLLKKLLHFHQTHYLLKMFHTAQKMTKPLMENFFFVQCMTTKSNAISRILLFINISILENLTAPNKKFSNIR